VMPHFDTPKRDKDTVNLVRDTLEKHFVQRQLKHRDVEWRNIGVYKDGVSTKAIVYDLDGLSEDDSRVWVDDAITHLTRHIE
jgi:hypothetical protein